MQLKEPGEVVDRATAWIQKNKETPRVYPNGNENVGEIAA